MPIQLPSDYQDRAKLLSDTEKGSIHDRLIQNIQSEYEMSWRFARPWIQNQLVRLKLYNNQKREKDRVGDPLIFTNFQSLLSVLYDDKLAASFSPREEGDTEQGENLDALAEFDYDEMAKAEHDYEWDWDTLAFGRGLSYFNEFDRDSNTPIPEVWDGVTFIYDPRAESVNGNRLGRGGMRFGGREVGMSKKEMNDQGRYFNLGKLKKDEGRMLSLTFEARQARADAQGMTNLGTFENKLSENYEFRILQWFTHLDGEKYLVELGNERKTIVRIEKLKWNRWPIIDRPCFPMAHDWRGVSVFDILEDKQRFRAVMLNYLGDHARSDVHPMYLFDENSIRKQIDKNFGFNKWIPVSGNPRDKVMALQKAQISSQTAFLLNFFDVAAQRALAIPELQQGVPSDKDRTATELSLISAKVDTRFSLTSRIWGWSEAGFWRQWYKIYDRDFPDGIGKKAMRLTGVSGPAWREIDRGKIIMKNSLGPDIKIESRVVSEARKLRSYAQASQYMAQIFQLPGTDVLYGARELGKMIMPREKVERLLPLTIDERIAKQENEVLNKGDVVPVKREDNHIVHLRMHIAAKDNEQTRDHVKAHELALIFQKLRPELFPPASFEQPLALGNESLAKNAGLKTEGRLVSPAPEGSVSQTPTPITANA